VLQDGEFYGAIEQKSFPTDGPESAFNAAAQYFREFGRELPLESLGISLYGIVENGSSGKRSRFLGSIQENWTGVFHIYMKLKQCWEKEGVRIVSEDRVYSHTDAAAAAIAEFLWGKGAASDVAWHKDFKRQNIVYFKLLEGIGSGVVLAGQLWEGSLHPEMGHLPIRRYKDDTYRGRCSAHTNCAEGLASFAALRDRLAEDRISSFHELPSSHKIWNTQAYYLAELALVAALVTAPQRIVFEGDFINERLLISVREHFDDIIAAYPPHGFNSASQPQGQLIVQSAFTGADASLLGALELARRQLPDIWLKEQSQHEAGMRLTARTTHPKEFSDSLENMKRKREAESQKTLLIPATPRAAQYVFGLSLSENVEWGIAEVVSGAITNKITRGQFEGIPSGNLPHSNTSTYIDIENMLKQHLRKLKSERPTIFRETIGLGISTIGVVGRDRLTLDSVSRKDWRKINSNYIVNFSDLLLSSSDSDSESLFPLVKSQKNIVVQNDASAQCLTEYWLGGGFQEQVPSLLYLTVGEGVNGAVVYHGDLLDMDRHSEMGHCLPQLHPNDATALSRPSGCPVHRTCFEGLASDGRIRQQWGANLSQLPGDHEAWEMEAFYLAQLVMVGITTLNPKQVRLGGDVFAGVRGLALLELVRNRFRKQNGAYLPAYKNAASVSRLIQRAKFGKGAKVLSALTMGWMAAYPENSRITVRDAGAKIIPLRPPPTEEH
jgi:fructokinase